MKTFRRITPARLALPAALLSVCSLAQAEPPFQYKLYGLLNVQVESVEAQGGATPYRHRGRVSDGNSRLGFSGSFDIDGSARGMWQLEGGLNNFEQGGVNDQGSSATLSSRNSFVGIEDDSLGRVVIGNNDSAYRSLVGSGGELGGNLGLTSHGLDLWNNTSAQLTGNANSLFGRGEARYKNSVHYLSPVWAGVQVAASYGLDEALADGANHDRHSLALKYTLGAFQIGFGYDGQKNSGADIDRLQKGFGFTVNGQTGVNTSYMKLVASYKLPTRTYIGFGAEQASYGYSMFVPPSAGNIYPGTQTGQMKQTGLMLSLAQDIGPRASVMGSIGRLGALNNAQVGAGADYGATQYSVGAQYRFNKNLATYITVTRIQNKPMQSVNLGQSPLYSNDPTTANAYLAPGDSPRALGFGLVAQF